MPLDRKQWETLVVAAELMATLCTSFWLATRRSGRVDRLPLSSVAAALLQPRSCWSLRALLAFRAGAATFFVLVQICDVWRSHGRCLAFYTSWNFILQGAYFGGAAWRTRRQLQRRLDERTASYTALVDNDDDGSDSAFARPRRVLRASGVHWIDLELLLDVCLAASLLICAVVWAVLYPYAVKIGHPETILNGVSYCQHGVNVLLLQMDFFATRHQVSRDAFPLVMGWPSVYAVFAWIVHGTVARGFWPYPFLDLDTPWAPLWYGGLLAAHVVALMLVMLLSRVKHKEQRSVTFADPVEA
ncbi:hypothetical protein PF005_g6255 [Phytophthora fragariae]|uniref:Uncharacterized protein n=1 Tax=Phytophthora fragariae TaxID=53985 RepID=A0A6A3UGP8_9STRA|nr:hypothetical protein PF003_g991 [Phytophthora fragariae]KAE8943352.1 hypothetical protein PF009_g6926 [Phytophthora fragariae]KAE9020773.1 hypothetical protein PF011_g5253 [Phytophthora fragariae]KAE9125365.1 hypothetical protein PF007_g6375 [Phytophthora fragariae]KAE9126026.1 hypothetical protein PF010_g5411 [Phytophthora fragariae]